MIEPQRQPDHEHVEPNAELRAGIEHIFHFLGEYRALDFGQEQAEQRWPQDHAGDHFADHLGLAEKLLAQPANNPACDDNNGQLQEEMGGKIPWRIASRDAIGADRAMWRQDIGYFMDGALQQVRWRQIDHIHLVSPVVYCDEIMVRAL